MKKALLGALFTIITASVCAQQQPVLSQYMLNNYYFNPAYSSTGELYHFSLLHRSQWSGYTDYYGNDGAPQIQLLTATANVDSTGHTFGLMASRDKTAALTTFQAQLSYAYRLQLTSKSTLALGVRGGFATKSVDYSNYIIKHPDDAYIREGTQSETKPDITLGLWYNHEKYYAGISARGIVTKADYNTLGLKNEKDIMITAGYHVTLESDWKLTPSIQIITTTHQTLVQGGILFDHDGLLWAGLAYRHEEAATVMAGFSLLEKKLRVGYSFDYITGNRTAKAATSHEVMLAYRLGRLHTVKKIHPKKSQQTVTETEEEECIDE